MTKPTNPTNQPKPSQDGKDRRPLADVIADGDLYEAPGERLMTLR